MAVPQLFTSPDLIVSELFYSLQGEGPSIGSPAVFLRLAGCNLRCRWCDTAYARVVNHGTRRMTGDVVIQYIKRHARGFVYPVLVVTGGEPLLQQDALIPLAKATRTMGVHSEVETNGTIVPKYSIITGVAQFNVSPKLRHSGNDVKARNPSALVTFARIRTALFKFVIDTRKDLDEVEEMVRAYAIHPSRVLAMPRTGPDVKGGARVAKMQWLAEECKKKGWRLSPRLHVELWEGRRRR